MNDIYMVLPGCDDTNRGDQALIWETVDIAQQAGFKGRYYMVAEKENSIQSHKEGIGSMDYILPHPSSHFKNNKNIQYGVSLKVKWMLVSLWDAFKAILLLNSFFRKLLSRFYSDSVRKSLRIYEKSKAAFVKGGGFLHSYGGFVNLYSNFYNMYPIMLALAMGKDVYVMPNSYGPFLSPGSSGLVKSVLGKCKFISSRESMSKTILKNETGLDSALFPDLAFYLEKDDVLNETQLKELNKVPFEKKCVALTVRPYRFPHSDTPKEDYLKYKNAICDIVRYISTKGYYPVLVEHTFSTNEHEQDISCIHDIESILGDTCDYSVFSDRSFTCRQMKYLYSRFEAIIGTRFHSIIFSIASGVPSLAITYGGNKGQGIMRDIGLEKYAIDISQIDSERLIAAFDALLSEKESLKYKIDNYIGYTEKKKDELIQCLSRMKKK